MPMALILSAGVLQPLPDMKAGLIEVIYSVIAKVPVMLPFC